MTDPKRCAVCGHKPSDHPVGMMGASMWTAKVGELLLCHTDDHSCYEGQQVASAGSGLLDHLRMLQ